MDVLLAACLVGADRFALGGCFYQFSARHAEAFAFLKLLLDRLAAFDLLVDQTEELDTSTVAGEESWLRLLMLVDPFDVSDGLADV